MKIKDVMSSGSLKYCSPETKLEKAAKLMKDSNLGALPVVDKTQNVVGILTDRDICLQLAEKPAKTVSEMPVSDALASASVRTVHPEDPIEDALREMRKHKVGRLPVTNKEGKLTGIISVSNILSRFIADDEEIGSLASKEENLAKTMKALFDRNNSKGPKEKSEPMELEADEE